MQQVSTTQKESQAMTNLPEAVAAAEQIGVLFWTERNKGKFAAIISTAFAPLVEERDRLAIEQNHWMEVAQQLQAKLGAVLKAGEWYLAEGLSHSRQAFREALKEARGK